MSKSIILSSIGFGASIVSSAASAQTRDTATETEETEPNIVVTGTSIRHDQFQAVTPVDVITEEQIEQTGFVTVTDLVREIPSNIGSEANRSAFTQNNTLGTAQVNLRGLGLGSTLVLLNGRRNVLSATFANDGSQFVDINQLPLSLIQRTEVVKTGASAIYGSDAVAGVVNFITHRNFEGVEIDAQFQTTTEASQEDIVVNLLGGFGAGDTHFTFAATYFDRSDLRFTDRDFTDQGTENEIATTKPGAFLLLAPPGNPAFAGTPVGVPFADPGCASAGGSPVTTPGGQFCQVSARSQFALVPNEERISVYGDIRHESPSGFEGFVELLYSDSEASVSGRPAALPGAGASGAIIVSPANAFNPFGAPAVFIGRPLDLSEATATDRSESETFRVAVGAGYEFDSGIRIDASYVRAENDFDLIANDLLASEFFIPGTNTVRNDLNLFATALTDPALANDAAIIDAVTTQVPFSFDSSVDVVELSSTGVLAELGSQPLGYAVGVQYRRNQASFDVPDLIETPGQVVFLFPQADFEGEAIEATAVYGELAIPIGERIDVQAALRYESYSDGIGDTLDPKVAVTADVTDDLVARASFGTSLRAPTPLQTGGQTSQVGPIVNPCTGQRLATSFLTRGNGDLEPESASTFSAGLAYRQPGGLRASVDYWNYDYEDVITRQSVEAVAANAQCVEVAPGVFVPVANGITLNPVTGQIAEIAVDFVNAGGIQTDGLDVAVGYDFGVGRAGLLSADLALTWITSFDVSETPGAPLVDRLGSRNVTSFTRPTPEVRGNVRLAWELDNHRLTAIVRHTDSYRDDLNADARIDSHTTLDLQYAFNLGDLFSARDTELRIGAINVTNEDPPFVNDRGGYDPLVADPRGRLVYVAFSTGF